MDLADKTLTVHMIFRCLELSLFTFGSFWKLLEVFRTWRESLNLDLELEFILIKFELNLKVFEVFLKNYLGSPAT